MYHIGGTAPAQIRNVLSVAQTDASAAPTRSALQHSIYAGYRLASNLLLMITNALRGGVRVITKGRYEQ